MNCPACSRDNAAGRRYCGGCGCNFAPGCTQCGFANTQADRFCGGCGVAMHAAARDAVALGPALPAAAPASPRVASSTTPWAADELAALFQTTPEPERPELPEAGINQDDINRVFGVEL